MSSTPRRSNTSVSAISSRGKALFFLIGASLMSHLSNAPHRPARRHFLRRGLFAGLSGLFSAGSRAAEGQGAAPPPVQPLDSMLVFERGDNNNERAMTHEVLSLIHQEKGRRSYPWTLYASLETHHEEGDA